MTKWEQKERGAPFMLRLLLWVTYKLGRRGARAFLYPTVAYFLLTGPAGRRASRKSLGRILGRILGRRANLWDVAKHFFAFSACTLDRIFLLTDLFEQLNPKLAAQIIDASERGPALVLRLKEALQSGRMVGIGADRAYPGERTIEVQFMGGTAHVRKDRGRWPQRWACRLFWVLVCIAAACATTCILNYLASALLPLVARGPPNCSRMRKPMRCDLSVTRASPPTTGLISTTTGTRTNPRIPNRQDRRFKPASPTSALSIIFAPT